MIFGVSIGSKNNWGLVLMHFVLPLVSYYKSENAKQGLIETHIFLFLGEEKDSCDI